MHEILDVIINIEKSQFYIDFEHDKVTFIFTMATLVSSWNQRDPKTLRKLYSDSPIDVTKRTKVKTKGKSNSHMKNTIPSRHIWKRRT